MYPNKRSKKSPGNVKKVLGTSRKWNGHMVQRRRAEEHKYSSLVL